MNAPIETIENQLLEISQTIGSIAEKNGQYTHSLAFRLSRIDKPLSQLTIFTFVEQIDKYNIEFNSKFGGDL